MTVLLQNDTKKAKQNIIRLSKTPSQPGPGLFFLIIILPKWIETVYIVGKVYFTYYGECTHNVGFFWQIIL